MCCLDLETHFLNCKPFYSPREFCSFILVSVYIPPQAHVTSALQKLANLITDTEQKHPDLADRSVFEAAANDLDELTETNILYQFLWGYVHSYRTRLTYNDDKLWFTAKYRQIRQAKEDAYRNGGHNYCTNRPKTHWKRRSEWQRGIILASKGTNYLPVILLQCGKVWKTLQITRHHPPALWRINNQQMIFMSFTEDLEKHPTPVLNTSPHNH